MKPGISKSEDAVSPVIGTVLIVLITVILGVAFSSQADGGIQDPSPQLILKASSVNSSTFKLEHLGGDPVMFEEITKAFLSINGQSCELDVSPIRSALGGGPLEVGNCITFSLTARNPGEQSRLLINRDDRVTLKIVNDQSRTMIHIQDVDIRMAQD